MVTLFFCTSSVSKPELLDRKLCLVSEETTVRHMKKHLSLQLNSRPIRPGFGSALQWTVFRSANTKIFRLNPTLFLVTFEIKL